jgi:uncharacterized protein YyaL (SSP411 family)
MTKGVRLQLETKLLRLYENRQEYKMISRSQVRIVSTLLFIFAALSVAWLLNNNAKNHIGNSNIEANNSEASKQAYTNQLAFSSSPYLKQHAHNPVDWYPWDNEALGRAISRDRMIVLSIGYSTCYWCHVMERTVFSDEEVAEVMNRSFVSIKVDKEERPDIDNIYMVATNVLSGRGGWPNNILLTPDLKPFYAASYMPKDDWLAMLKAAEKDWQIPEKREEMTDGAARVASIVGNYFSGYGKKSDIKDTPEKLAQDTVMELASEFDRKHGGFGTNLKFPQEMKLLFLLDNYRLEKNDKTLHIVSHTVDNILSGGVYDHIGGGFHRYSIDRKWRQPHFEKMLYNQAYMLSVLAGLYELSKDKIYKEALIDTANYIESWMTDDSGAFYSAMDAETDAVEGAYYTWTEDQLQQAVSEDDLTTILASYSLEEFSQQQGEQLAGKILFLRQDEDIKPIRLSSEIKAKMLAAREERKAPRVDRKVITAWNGMMINGYIEAGRVLGEQKYTERAVKAANFILSNMVNEDGKLNRIYAGNRVYQSAFLEDYAWASRAFIMVYKATGDNIYIEKAKELIAVLDNSFKDKKEGGYFLSSVEDEMMVRVKENVDTDSTPSANAVMAHIFVDLYEITGDKTWADKADEVFSAFAEGISNNPDNYVHMVHAYMRKGNISEEKVASYEKEKVAKRNVSKVAAIEKKESPKNIEPVKEANKREVRAPSKEVQKEIAVETPPSIKVIERKSSDKVSINARVLADISVPREKTIFVTMNTDKGWHVNANPSTIDFLIPTTLYISTENDSKIRVKYPESRKMETPLGEVDIYKDHFEIKGVVNTKEELDVEDIGILLEFQACNKYTCLEPSHIALNAPNW